MWHRPFSWRAIRQGAVTIGLLLLTLLVSLQLAWATSQGPVFTVDINSPTAEDGNHDYHYRTLTALFAPEAYPKPGEHDLVLVSPGVYPGTLVIRTKGLILRSTAGAKKTIIRGQLLIEAEDVQISGFSIDPQGRGPGVTIGRDGAELISNEIHDGTVGVLIGVQSGSRQVLLRQNRIFNNRQDGLSARDARELKLIANRIRGNGGAGALLKDLQGAIIQENIITFNRLGGLEILGSSQTQIVKNQISDNMLAAIMLKRASDTLVSANELSSNEIGLFLWGASANRLTGNTIRRNRAGGIFIRDGSQENVITDNQIEDNAGWGAPGLWLVGMVSGNRIGQNRLENNGVGVLLSGTAAGRPEGNLLEKNLIAGSDSEGGRVEASDGQNVWRGNEIKDNNGAGLALLAGSRETISANLIHDNGAQGIAITNAGNNRLQDNQIASNGDDGILIEKSPENLLSGNLITSNARSGLKLEQADRTRLKGNTITQNQNEGLYAEGGSGLYLAKNLIQDNGARGLHLQGVASADLQDNQVINNSRGGVLLSQVSQVDLQGNQISGNTQFGLEALQSPLVSARRNWWGDPRGPAGAFNGGGNAVIGLPLAQIVPWLPALPGELALTSVAGATLNWPRGNRIQFDVSDRADLDLEIYRAPALAQSAPLVTSRALLIAAKLSGPPPGAPLLKDPIKFVSVQVNGLKEGTAQLTVVYSDAELPPGVPAAELRLYSLERGRWQLLPGQAQPLFHRVSGELPLDRLRGQPIALAAGNSPPDPPHLRDWSLWRLLALTAWTIVP